MQAIAIINMCRHKQRVILRLYLNRIPMSLQVHKVVSVCIRLLTNDQADCIMYSGLSNTKNTTINQRRRSDVGTDNATQQ